MTTDQLLKKIDEINTIIEEEIKSEDSDSYPILDGIIDVEKYINAKFKILWILKEPYDDFDEEGKPEGGGWSLGDTIKEKTKIQDFSGGRPTFTPMIYAAYGIMNNFILWDDMENVENDATMLDYIKSIAYINVKKLPGYTKSDNNVIKDAFDKHKHILLKQIEIYNPDIIIGGSTLRLFFNDFGFSLENMLKKDSIHYIIKDDKLFIDAYHPAQREGSTGISQEKYCDDIILAAKEYAEVSNK